MGIQIAYAALVTLFSLGLALIILGIRDFIRGWREHNRRK